MPFYRTYERINYSYAINDNVLLFKGNEITDLGIVLYREVNFHAHLDKMYCKLVRHQKLLDYKKNLKLI